ncbi:hydrolase 1, exosortase A system-associated [Rheinheimera nanhaiensis]|uniref:Hydrolase n=1 Tax=Rheinheimera nanhaiensis E407-8 TaxID=562729 RepID=I1E339_9GAMM|nr:hydrolase 1, exosortase A system-associated [Rheinheimera nanhaiensis]GAB60717.1 hydrolase [Rheinheimera nanhaiensis E407-8]
MSEQFVSITCTDNSLSAILHQPDSDRQDTGVLILVGGPQYRVGSHRQFVKLSRALAAEGIASLRLDAAGMGDSSGTKAEFYQQDAEIEAGITALMQQCPQLKNVVLWGLCDAASAILLYLNKPDPRVSGTVLLNPWVRQQHSHAEVMLKHYYVKRLFSRQFWQKLFGGGVALKHSIQGLWQTLQQRRANRPAASITPQANAQNYVQLMLRGWQRFSGQVLIITSGNDLTAQEFLQLCATDTAWAGCLAKAQHSQISEANHTFSSQLWRGQVEQATLQWLQTP